MLELLNNGVGKTVAAGTLAGLAMAGCSGGSKGAEPLKVDKSPVVGSPASPYAGMLHCKPDSPEKWGPTPTNFSAERIAAALKVSVEAVQNGKFGGATCDEAVKPSQIIGAKAVVEGMGDICAVVGTGSDPRTDKASKQILAVCVVEATPEPAA